MKSDSQLLRVEGSTVGQEHRREGVEIGNQKKQILLKDDIIQPNSFMMFKKENKSKEEHSTYLSLNKFMDSPVDIHYVGER